MGVYPQNGSQARKDTPAPTVTTTSFTIIETRTQPEGPRMDEWAKETWYVRTKKYYLAVKKKAGPFATTWMDPGRGAQPVSRLQKDKWCGTPLF